MDVWDSNTPHEQFVAKETTEIVRLLLHELKQEYREVLVLREYEQMTYAEIADVTETTESSVKSRIFKARKALAARLKPFFQQERSL
jgi:RNA polymerase sigma-70 factor (ECF subfamily)